MLILHISYCEIGKRKATGIESVQLNEDFWWFWFGPTDWRYWRRSRAV